MRARTAAPTLGEHTRHVMGAVVGVPDDEYARLEADGAFR